MFAFILRVYIIGLNTTRSHGVQTHCVPCWVQWLRRNLIGNVIVEFIDIGTQLVRRGIRGHGAQRACISIVDVEETRHPSCMDYTLLYSLSMA